MGHIVNRSHGQWGTWAMGPMGDWDIFAHNIINTGWILTKILLDIDINIFYLNTGRFFHDGSIKGIFPMDFKFCLLSAGPPCSLHGNPHYIFTHAR